MVAVGQALDDIMNLEPNTKRTNLPRPVTFDVLRAGCHSRGHKPSKSPAYVDPACQICTKRQGSNFRSVCCGKSRLMTLVPPTYDCSNSISQSIPRECRTRSHHRATWVCFGQKRAWLFFINIPSHKEISLRTHTRDEA
jgi:hypothetical protein